MKDGGRGRGPQKQSSINSLLSLQPHCGNFGCGPQIKWNRFNLWRHPRLQLMVLVSFTCLCQTQSFSPLWVCFVSGSSHAMPAFSEQKKIVFSANTEISVIQSRVYSQSCLDSNVFLSHEGVAHTATRLPPTPPHPPSCGYTTGEKCGPVTISQKTPAGWLSWRLLTSA